MSTSDASVDHSVDSEDEIRVDAEEDETCSSGQKKANYKMTSCLPLRFIIGGERDRKRAFWLEENGRLLLEEMIASCDGQCKQTIRTFSAKDLQEATNNFDPDRVLHHDRYWKLYKGMEGKHPICIRKYKPMGRYAADARGDAITDIVIGSQMSAHGNVLKLIGCCLESEIPMMVYQFADESLFTLNDYIFARSENKGLQPLPWKSRIRIAMSTASAIAYLHTALLRPVVHRNISPWKIIIDGNNMIPKLLDFSISVSIPEGETHVKTLIVGTRGFIDPTCITSCLVNEKSDVYSFGIVLLMLLTGNIPTFEEDNTYQPVMECLMTCIDKDRFKERLDPSILAEGSWLEKEEQVYKFCELGIKCVSRVPEARPTMIEVGKELTQIYQSLPSLVN